MPEPTHVYLTFVGENPDNLLQTDIYWSTHSSAEVAIKKAKELMGEPLEWIGDGETVSKYVCSVEVVQDTINVTEDDDYDAKVSVFNLPEGVLEKGQDDLVRKMLLEFRRGEFPEGVNDEQKKELILALEKHAKDLV